MADRYTAQVSGVTTSAASTETLLQLLADADSRVKVWGWTFTMDDTVANEPGVLCEVLRQTTAGTSSGSVTPSPLDDQAPTADTLVDSTFSIEPTAGAIIDSAYVHPQLGSWSVQLAEPIIMNVSTRLGFRTTTTGTGTPDAHVSVHFEE